METQEISTKGDDEETGRSTRDLVTQELHNT